MAFALDAVFAPDEIFALHIRDVTILLLSGDAAQHPSHDGSESLVKLTLVPLLIVVGLGAIMLRTELVKAQVMCCSTIIGTSISRTLDAQGRWGPKA